MEGTHLTPWFFLGEASDRLLRDAATLALMVSEYMAEGRKPPEDADWEAAHARAAHRLLVLCAANRGVYIKLGQHVAMLEHLLPGPYVRAMEPMCHTAPKSTFEDVKAVLEAELKRPLEEVFSDFEREPVASASLAQVHKARLRSSGQLVAVKVQHRGLAASGAIDLRTVSALARLVKAWYPKFEYGWLVEEIRDNLPKELDFRLEADNARRARALLAHREDVVVPAVVGEVSTARVLTMSFEEGVYVTDRETIARQGLEAADVAQSISTLFNEMIFQHGFVHCDPHVGNLLVRPRADNPAKPAIVLLDHGLYKTINPAFRLSYARLWTSLIFADEGGIRESAAFFNAGKDGEYQLFAAMLTTKPWEQIINPSLSSLQVDRTAQGRQETGDYAKEYANEINALLGRVPRDLLLLLKTLDCLRSIDASLGSPVDTFQITARSCLACVQEQRGAGIWPFLTNTMDWASLESRFAMFHLASWLTGSDGMPLPSSAAVTMIGQANRAE